MIAELTPDQLRAVCDPKDVGCQTSAEITSLGNIIGQERAVRALKFGLGIKEKGFNIYVAGIPGTGRTTAIKRFLEEIARDEPTPSDWCYVNNFRDSSQPNALALLPGLATTFHQEMQDLIAAAVREIRTVFESEEYAARREDGLKQFQAQKQELLGQLEKEAAQAGFLLQVTQVGLMTIPVLDGKPLSQEEFLALSDEQKEEFTRKGEALRANLETSLRQAKGLDKSAGEAMKKLDETIAQYAIGHLFDELKGKFTQDAEVLDYLELVRSDIIANLPQFKSSGEEQPESLSPGKPGIEAVLKKYQVNVLVDNSTLEGAPVVLELNPTYTNLFGRVEKEARFGALLTDYTMARGGSLHRANGGYLVLPVNDLLSTPFAWDGLKRALANNQIVIEDPGEKMGLVSTRSLQPEPVPLNVKVVLIGRPDVYQMLFTLDEEFNELFKVKADFDTEMLRNNENICAYAGFVATICQLEHLRHLDAAAIARVVDHGSRIVEDQERLSSHFGEIADVIREASYYAGLDGAELVGAAHVGRAIDERFYRSSLLHERIQETIERQVIKIDVSGSQVGQVNGLSVISLGDISFGQPNRITASVGLGREGILDIEREAKLGGPIHTKGVMILSGYLLGKYAQDKPLSLAAQLVFEQSYSGVEGDSASSTELYALLSALSDLPIRQGIAVTGSVNQKGEVQAIGGVNEKIEGFFALCQSLGLTGKQGVLIPHSNAKHLMLKAPVVEAVRQGQFHVWPVQTIDQGIEILTGVAAGERGEDGAFPEGSVNARVDARLRELGEMLSAFGEAKKDESQGEADGEGSDNKPDEGA